MLAPLIYFVQLWDGSTPRPIFVELNALNIIWKTHTCPNKASQLIEHIRAKIWFKRFQPQCFCTMSYKVLFRQVCASQIMSNLIQHSWTLMKVQNHCKAEQKKWTTPERLTWVWQVSDPVVLGNAAFQAGFWNRKLQLQVTTYDFVAFQATHSCFSDLFYLWKWL